MFSALGHPPAFPGLSLISLSFSWSLSASRFLWLEEGHQGLQLTVSCLTLPVQSANGDISLRTNGPI